MNRAELHQLMEFVDGAAIGALVGWVVWSAIIYVAERFA